jgi:hypothetical protein
MVEDGEPLPRYVPELPADDEYQRITAQGKDTYRRRVPIWCARDTWTTEEAASLFAGILPRADGEGRIFHRRYRSDTGTVVIGETEYPNAIFRIFTDNFDCYERVLEELRGSPFGELAQPKEWALFANARGWLPAIKRPDIDNSPLLSLLEPGDTSILLSPSRTEAIPQWKSKSTYSTPLLAIQLAAIEQFFDPRQNPDPKKEEVVEWIIAKLARARLKESRQIAEAIFTVIKPEDHDPKKKRGEPR